MSLVTLGGSSSPHRARTNASMKEHAGKNTSTCKYTLPGWKYTLWFAHAADALPRRYMYLLPPRRAYKVRATVTFVEDLRYARETVKFLDV